MPANNIPLINGKAYSWGNISILLNGTPVVGCTAINYDDQEEKENGYGAGKMPIERGEGNYSATCSLTLKASELEALATLSPGGRLQDFGIFDIVVSYLVGTVRKVHKIRNCEFTNNGRNINQGDRTIEREMNLICSHIEWQ